MANVFVLRIAAPSGGGKTTVADEVVKHYQLQGKRCIKISVDDYYKKDPQPGTNFDHPDAVELELLAAHLEALQEGETIEVPTYSFTKSTRLAETKPITPSEGMIIVVEGIFALNEKLGEINDFKIYVDTRLDICLARRLRRDEIERGTSIEENLAYYEKNIIPNLHFVLDTKAEADFIMPTSNSEDIKKLIEAVDSQVLQPVKSSQPYTTARFFATAETDTQTPRIPEQTTGQTTLISETFGQSSMPGLGGSVN
ncbi:uridine kinase family protein [Legionella drozanskii]|uniref:Uridine kinase n=1 Tax=Legionella drozanskii LLAP-1 TaxID=1212489 RepID=A0A0W0SR93_9GAMM|nr:hypothetical protein [Legionella drozanskii]KTC85896.1 uridine kinase [Legionella drozanskii LLAP-1]